MSRLLCCLRGRHDMGAALSAVQEGDACDGAGLPTAAPTMADVIRERKKKAGGAALGTLRRRLAAAARRPRDNRPDRGCEHARFIRSVVCGWRLSEVFLLCEELEAGAALRDLVTQAELAREPAPALHHALPPAFTDRWWCDVELVGAGWSIFAHRCILAARCSYFRRLLQRYPPPMSRIPLEGACAGLPRAELHAAVRALYGAAQWEQSDNPEGDLDIINVDQTNSLCRGSCRAGAGVATLLGVSADSLHRDMRYLLESGEMSDCRLSWGGYELPAHRVILAARSRYFRSVMSRRGAGGVVVVDHELLPPRYGRVLLHAAYTDQVDLTLIGRNSSSPSSTTSGSGSAWPGRGRASSQAVLDDAFQLYEIARFLEMSIAVQGCEDAIVEALSPDTLPAVLRWASAPHASRWVHRQAMRYLRDEFPAIMASSASARLPRSALADVLASPFLQASEAQVLRALLRWADRQDTQEGASWQSSAARRRRRDGSCAAGPALAPLLPLLRTHLLPPAHDLLHQLVRRGLMPASPQPTGQALADAWLGRSTKPARCFLPYLDELKALLQQQAAPEAELARMRRARTQRMPDMVAGSGAVCAPSGSAACVSPPLRRGLRARYRELSAAAPALRARTLHAHDPSPVRTQIALRVVREMSLPDACADLLLHDDLRDNEWDSPTERRWEPDCCRLSTGRCASSASVRSSNEQGDNSRSSTGRRELPSRSSDSTQHSRQSLVSVGGVGGCVGGRLSQCVPDVAMAPNANTHLLATPYCRPAEYGGGGGGLQLDLGDGATHTPRPGSRAARALAAGRPPDVPTRGYPFQPRPASPGPPLGGDSPGAAAGGRCRTLPRCRDLPPALHHTTVSRRQNAVSSLGAHLHHQPLSRGGSGPGSQPSPRRTQHYRLEPTYGSSGSSRGHSPNNYA